MEISWVLQIIGHKPKYWRDSNVDLLWIILKGKWTFVPNVIHTIVGDTFYFKSQMSTSLVALKKTLLTMSVWTKFCANPCSRFGDISLYKWKRLRTGGARWSLWITTVRRSHHLGTMNVCATFPSNPWNSCWGCWVCNMWWTNWHFHPQR